MKTVILTEGQLKNIISEEGEYILAKQLNESLNLDDIKKKIKKALLIGITAATIIGAVNKMGISQMEKDDLIEYVEEMLPEADTIHDQKVQACKDYMEWAMKNQGYDWSTTNLTPEALVTACEENNFNLAFTLAIANLESCFGQTNRAKTTNSVFSVGSYDSGKNVCTYSSPDESIVPFINLIKNDYLADDTTLDDLLKPGSFVNMNGKRYASDKGYEGKVKSIMNRIIKMYPILNT